MGYDEQLSAAKFRAERDQARQERERLRARLRDSVPREAYERKRAPVLAADRKPLREGETVWDWNGDEYVVERIYSGTTEPDFPGHTVACRRPDDIVTHMFEPSQLTHQRPVLDAGGVPIKGGDTIYSDGHKEGLIVDGYQHVDLVRRAKKLAGDA